MLAQRVATALTLLAIFVAALWARSAWPFAILMLGFVAACAWEWGRLVGLGSQASLILAGLVAVVALGVPSQVVGLDADGLGEGRMAWWLVSLAWVGAGAWLLGQGVDGWRRWPMGVKAILGVLALSTTWFAVTAAHRVGINFMLSILMLIWASDIAAYFGGRAFGGRWFGLRRLAPGISPGKTIEGVVWALVGALVLACLWVAWVDRQPWVDGPSFFSRVLKDRGLGWMVLTCVALVLAGIMGDLLESLMKRAVGAKDSSRLLPGHGGALDRLDALLPVLPLALALTTASSTR